MYICSQEIPLSTTFIAQHTFLRIVFLSPFGSIDFKYFLLQLLSGPDDYLFASVGCSFHGFGGYHLSCLPWIPSLTLLQLEDALRVFSSFVFVGMCSMA